MTTIERKSKFLHSKAIHRKKKERLWRQAGCGIHPKKIKYIHDGEANLIIDGSTTSHKITDKYINKLINCKKIVDIYYGEYGDETVGASGMIIKCNKNYLIFHDFCNLHGDLSIIFINRIRMIKVCGGCVALGYKHNFESSNKKYDYFNNNKTFLQRVPTEIEHKILDRVDLINYNHFLEYNIKNTIELFHYLKNKDLILRFTIETIKPLLFAKIININDNNLELQAMDLEGVFLTETTIIEISDIEYLTVIYNFNYKLDNHGWINHWKNNMHQNLNGIELK